DVHLPAVSQVDATASGSAIKGNGTVVDRQDTALLLNCATLIYSTVATDCAVVDRYVAFINVDCPTRFIRRNTPTRLVLVEGAVFNDQFVTGRIIDAAAWAN